MFLRRSVGDEKLRAREKIVNRAGPFSGIPEGSPWGMTRESRFLASWTDTDRADLAEGRGALDGDSDFHWRWTLLLRNGEEMAAFRLSLAGSLRASARVLGFLR